MRKVTSKMVRLGILFLLVLLLATLPVSTVSAALRTCRTDPIVLLSNGYGMAISSLVGTDVTNVVTIRYTLHVPQGVTANRVVYTGGGLAGKETLTLVADQANGRYAVETAVSTRVGSASVSTTFNLFTVERITGTGISGEAFRIEQSAP